MFFHGYTSNLKRIQMALLATASHIVTHFVKSVPPSPPPLSVARNPQSFPMGCSKVTPFGLWLFQCQQKRPQLSQVPVGGPCMVSLLLAAPLAKLLRPFMSIHPPQPHSKHTNRPCTRERLVWMCVCDGLAHYYRLNALPGAAGVPHLPVGGEINTSRAL